MEQLECEIKSFFAEKYNLIYTRGISVEKEDNLYTLTLSLNIEDKPYVLMVECLNDDDFLEYIKKQLAKDRRFDVSYAIAVMQDRTNHVI